MRYSVDQQYLFLYVKFQQVKENFVNLYLPWKDKLEEIQILPMTCTACHKVRWEWEDDTVEPSYDGFIFKDESSREWYNHYPRYTGGQISDENLYRVSPADPSDGEMFFSMEQVEQYLERVLRGLRAVELDSDQKAALQGHYDEIVAKVVALGWEVTTRPRVARFIDARPPMIDTKRRRVYLKKLRPRSAADGRVCIYYWRDGRASAIRAQDTSSGFAKLGYGNGAAAALDFYAEDVKSWMWDPKKAAWSTMQDKAFFTATDVQMEDVYNAAVFHQTTTVQLEDGSEVILTSEGTPYYTVTHQRLVEGEVVPLMEDPWTFHTSDFTQAFEAFWEQVTNPYGKKDAPALATTLEEIDARLDRGFSWNPPMPR